jgi:hypothetical protein
MTNLFCNVLVKFEKGAVEAEQGAIYELAWKKSHSTQHRYLGQVYLLRLFNSFSMSSNEASRHGLNDFLLVVKNEIDYEIKTNIPHYVLCLQSDWIVCDAYEIPDIEPRA